MSGWDPNGVVSAKLARSKLHLDELNVVVSDYLRRRPYSVREDPTDQTNRRVAKLIVSEPIPDTVPLIVGDAVHNMRSALDAYVYGLARTRLGEKWKADYERQTQFPIARDKERFEEFFNFKARRVIFDQQLRDALWQVQPTYYAESVGEAVEGDAMKATIDDNYKYDELKRLDDLWNIDKHRRVTVAAFVPDLLHWGSNGDYSRSVTGPRTGDSQEIICYITDDPQTNHFATDMSYEFKLALTDDPGLPRDLRDLLNGIHGKIANWIIPSINNHLVRLEAADE